MSPEADLNLERDLQGVKETKSYISTLKQTLQHEWKISTLLKVT